MLKKEFDDRMGCITSDEEYGIANSVYVDANDFDKDQFVKEWKKIIKHPLVKILIKKSSFWEDSYFNELCKRNKSLDLIQRVEELILNFKSEKTRTK